MASWHLPIYGSARPHKNDAHRIPNVYIDLPLLLIYEQLLKELKRRNLYQLLMECSMKIKAEVLFS